MYNLKQQKILPDMGINIIFVSFPLNIKIMGLVKNVISKMWPSLQGGEEEKEVRNTRN